MSNKRAIWIIGDDLLDNAAQKLEEMRMDQNNGLYIHEYFEVTTLEDKKPRYMNNNPYVKISGNLIQGINENPYSLPTIIIILLSNSYAHDEAFIKYEFKSMIQLLLQRITNTLAERKKKERNSSQKRFLTNVSQQSCSCDFCQNQLSR